MFVPIEFDHYLPYADILKNYSGGISEGEEHKKAIEQYGNCNIDLPDKGIFVLLFENVLSPFYIFQIFSCIMWYNDDYEIYAS